MKKSQKLLPAFVFCISTSLINPMDQSMEDIFDYTDYEISSFFRDKSEQTLEKAEQLKVIIQAEQAKYYTQTSSTRTLFQNIILKNIDTLTAMRKEENTKYKYTRPKPINAEAISTTLKTACSKSR